MKRFLGIPAIPAVVATVGAAALAFAAPASASIGPPGGTIYAEGEAFQTVGTPTALPDSGPFDTLYVIDGFAAVSDAAPGDRDFNGGRWHVVEVSGHYTEQPTSEDEVLAGATSLTVTDIRFVCPLIRG